MNERERYLETLLFGCPDKIPFATGHPRESTLKNWHRQGLPEGAHWLKCALDTIDVKLPEHSGRTKVSLTHTMIPQFEEKIIEELQDTFIVQDWKGNICEISKTFDVTYLRYARDFVTRRWIKCPVESWEDWEAMKSRYDPDDPSRVPINIQEIGRQMRDRDYVAGVQVHGPFWQMREWLGFEGLCVTFLDDPEMIRDMVRFWTEYIAHLLERVLPFVSLDYFHISEDMAYKTKAMISPEMTREFLAPCYNTWKDILMHYDVPIYDVDSDGYIGELIPVWIDCGINVCDPMEVAAGNDLNELRERFGKRMAFRGGVDKRAMAKGGETIRAEMARLEPVVQSGGYIPSCDHGIPSDVGWNEFLEYCDLLARMTGWK